MDALVTTCDGWKVADLAVHVGELLRLLDPRPLRGDRPAEDALPRAARGRRRWSPGSPSSPATWSTSSRRRRRPPRCGPGSPPTTPPGSSPAGARTSSRCTGPTCRPPAGTTRPSPPTWPSTASTRSSTRCSPCASTTGAGTGRSLALRSADTRTAWRITLGQDRIDVERPPVRPIQSSPRGNLVVTATASDLELTLYHRPTLSPVDMVGDYTVLDEWHRDFTF